LSTITPRLMVEGDIVVPGDVVAEVNGVYFVITFSSSVFMREFREYSVDVEL